METVGTPSQFWRDLAHAHSDELGRYGYGEIKRHQALRYFTWQWRWRQVLRSEQFKFLLRQTPLRALLRTVLTPQTLSAALWRGLPWGLGDRWLYTLATRLLWQYADRFGEGRVLALGEPALGNPPPVAWRGCLVSQDLANSALEAQAIQRALGGNVPSSIMEIGAGYGRTAYAMLGLFPAARYTIVDIEPALSLSRFYLSSLFPDRDITFIDAGSSDFTSLGSVDLAVSISSLHEMTPDQVAIYLQLLDGLLTEEGVVFLKQWEQWHNPVDDVVMRFVDYAIPQSWDRIFQEASPVQTRFVQAAWRRRSPAN